MSSLLSTDAVDEKRSWIIFSGKSEMAKSGKSDKCEFLERIWKMQESDYNQLLPIFIKVGNGAV